MPLPVLTPPTFDVVLLSQTKPVTCRPFLLGEEKVFLMAAESKDPKDVERAVAQVLRACTFDALDIENLPTFDVEYLFLQLRGKSVNSVIDMNLECRNVVRQLPAREGDDLRCHTHNKISIPIDEIRVVTPEGHTTKVVLSDKVGVIMRYPTAAVQAQLAEANQMQDLIAIIGKTLKTICIGDDVYPVDQLTPTEVTTFVEGLTLMQLDKLRAFYDSMPRVTHTVHFVCKSCGYTEDIVLAGLMDFFE